MNTFISGLPTWAQEVVAWSMTGAGIITLIGIITALVKLRTARKESKAVNSTQVTLLETMVGKLSNTKDLAQNVCEMSQKVAESLTYFEKALNAQKQSNANLAVFIMECFNKSNLSAKAKTDLKVLADKIFYDDNAAVIDVLKQAKLDADTAAAASAREVEELKTELAKQTEKLAKAQENVKTNRRI